MVRKAEIDPSGECAEIVSIRFARDIIKILDLLSDNRSEYVRDATYEKIRRDMEKK